MVRTVAALLFTIVAASPAAAQRRSMIAGSARRNAERTQYHKHGRDGAKPGVSQDAGTTPLDRGIERRDDAIGGTICKGC